MKFLGFFYAMGNRYEFVNKYYIIELIEWPGKCLLPPFSPPPPKTSLPSCFNSISLSLSFQTIDYQHQPTTLILHCYTSCCYMFLLVPSSIKFCYNMYLLAEDTKIPYDLPHPVFCSRYCNMDKKSQNVKKWVHLQVLSLGVCLKTFKI